MSVDFRRLIQLVEDATQRVAQSPLDNPNFRRWFAGSKVVDQNGNPLVMYHGTTGDIEAFDPARITKVDTDAPFNGFWFSSDPGTQPASSYPTNIMPVYLSIKNPAPWQVWRKVARQVIRDDDRNKPGSLRPHARSVNDEVRYRLEDMGYDGIIFDQRPVIDAEAFHRNGRHDFRDVTGRKHWLEKGTTKEVEWGMIPEEYEVWVVDDGQTQTRHGLGDTAGVLHRIMSLWDYENGEPFDRSQYNDKEGGIIRIGDRTVTIRKETIQSEQYGPKPTGRDLDTVEFYSDGVGHVTGYEDIDDFLRMHDEEVWVAFRPEQIKSVYNRGTWNPSNPKVTEAVDPEPAYETVRTRSLPDGRTIGRYTLGKTGETLFIETVPNWEHDADRFPDYDGKVLLVRAVMDGRTIGTATFYYQDGDRSGSVEDVRVAADQRRKGVATVMYDHLEHVVGLRPVPTGGRMEPDGQAFWRHRQGRGLTESTGSVVDPKGNWKTFDSLPDDAWVILYHGTSLESARSILEHGFQGGRQVWRDSEDGYVYLGLTPRSIAMYASHARGVGGPAFVKVKVQKHHVFPDDSGDWKSYLRSYRSDVVRQFGRDAVKKPTATVTLAEIGQAKAPMSLVVPLEIVDEYGVLRESEEPAGPVVTLEDEPRVEHKFGQDLTYYAFRISHPKLPKPALVTMEYWPEFKRATVNAYGSMENVNALGPAAMRQIVRQIKAHIPDLEGLQGPRVSGARANKPKFRDRFQRLDVSKIEVP